VEVTDYSSATSSHTRAIVEKQISREMQLMRYVKCQILRHQTHPMTLPLLKAGALMIMLTNLRSCTSLIISELCQLLSDLGFTVNHAKTCLACVD
jgi:hypothetical protein